MLACFSPITSLEFIVYSETGSVHLLNLRSNIHRRLFESLSITAIEYTSTGRQILMTLRDGTINLVDLNGNIKSVQKSSFHKGPINKIVTGNSDGVFMTVSNDMIALWSEVSLGKLAKM